MAAPMTSAEAAAAGHTPPFCEVHWSWLCAFGEGQCQRAVSAVTPPRRIQRKRTKGWRMPKGAVYVGRPTKWGSPFIVGKAQVRSPGENGVEWEYEGRSYKVTGQRTFFCTGIDAGGMPVGFWHDVHLATAEQCVQMYRQRLDRSDVSNLGAGESLTSIRRELGGHDLACWCPLDQPCHADVLLDVANRPDGE